MLGKWLLGTHSMFFLGLFSLIPALWILFIMDKWVNTALPSDLRLSSQFMLLTSGLFTGSAIVLRMDMLMSLFIILSRYTFYRIYTGRCSPADPIKLPIYIFLAIFTKGPVGLIIPLLTIPAFLLVKKQFKTIGKYLGWKQWSILIGLCSLWFIAVYLEGGKTYLNNLLFHQTINRAVDSFHHKEPFWYYLKTIWYSLAPWTLFYVVVLLIGIRKHLYNNDIKQLFLTILLTGFVVLTFSSAKLDIYLLPLFPFMAYLAFLLLPEIALPKIYFTIVLPAAVLVFVFPSLFFLPAFLSLPWLESSYFYFAAFLLSSSAILCLYYLYKNRFTNATNSLSVGLLLSILIGSVNISELNKYIGLKNITQKATRIAQEDGIKNYYFYKLRSGKNLDSYLNKQINEVDLPTIDSLSGKQNFILFVNRNTLKKESKLYNLYEHYKRYGLSPYDIKNIAKILDQEEINRIVDNYITIHPDIFTTISASKIGGMLRRTSLYELNFYLENEKVSYDKKLLTKVLNNLDEESIPIYKGTLFEGLKLEKERRISEKSNKILKKSLIK